jgi:hypothetical protein
VGVWVCGVCGCVWVGVWVGVWGCVGVRGVWVGVGGDKEQREWQVNV